MASAREPETLALHTEHAGTDRPGAVAETVASEPPAATEQRLVGAVHALAGPPVRMALPLTVLWTRFLRFDAADPRWPDRDRFVASPGCGTHLHRALLTLTGHAGMGLDRLQPDGVLPPLGPPGQGFGAAVGLTLAERLMAARFGKSLVDHRTWLVAGTADLMAGLSHEAASLASHLRLSKLTVLWDDLSGEGGGSVSSDDQLRRFAALGWAAKAVACDDMAGLAAALSLAIRSKKPMLIACRGSAPPLPGLDASAALADSALGDAGLLGRWRAAGHRGATARRGWLKRMQRHPLRAEFERAMGGRLPESWAGPLSALRAELAESKPVMASRQASHRALEALLPALPELVVGSAEPPEADGVPPRRQVPAGASAGRHVPYGLRDHVAAACMSGMALHGGILPCLGGSLAGSDVLRPVLRDAAGMRHRVIHVLTPDAAIPLAEHLAGFRALPGVLTMRPADAMETTECWELALRNQSGPSVLVLSTQSVPALRGDAAENRSARGGYVLAEAEGARRATLIATGPEVAQAMAARALLAAEGIPVAVVSLPCWSLFAAADPAARAAVLGSAPRFGIEAACGFGWERWLGADCAEDGSFIGITGFADPVPSEELQQQSGLTPEGIAAAVRRRLATQDSAGEKQ